MTTKPGPVLDLPVIEFDEVFHVGTLDLADRAAQSHEGDGLSVSLHPDEWSQIAELPATEVWEFSRPDYDPLRFVSFHDLTDGHLDALHSWGQSRGWIAEQQAYRTSWFDEECDDTRYCDFDTRAEAEAEADEDEGTVTEVSVWRATEIFPMQRVSGQVDPTDLVLCLYLAEVLPEVDGVWWDDDYAPHLLSCPRGVLVGDLAAYQRRRIA